MRALPLVLLVFLLCFCVVSARQNDRDEKSKQPRNGDSIVAKGCLRGSMLESTEIGMADGAERMPAGHTFQLKGKKDLLKQLRDKHDGHIVEISGVLKSNLMNGPERGTQVGRTRIVVGAESTTRDRAMPGADQPLPVLEAKSFEGSSTSCRR